MYKFVGACVLAEKRSWSLGKVQVRLSSKMETVVTWMSS